MQDIIWYVAWVIVPLFASIVLFLALNKVSASLDYKTKSFQLKLGGAAALFFVLFYLMNPVKLKLVKTDFAQDNWKLIVTSFKDQNGKPIPVEQLVRIDPIPNWDYTPLDQHQVMLTLPAVEKKKDNKISVPYMLRFIFTDYEAKTFLATDFNDKSFCDIKWDDQQIFLKNLPQLVLKEKLRQMQEPETEAANEKIINQ